MPDSAHDCARDRTPGTPWTGADRRKYPRRAMDKVEALPANEAASPSGPALLPARRLRARWGAVVRSFLAAVRPVEDRRDVRRRRLPGIARKLEAVLADLDDVGAWREAADVCSALERLRTEIAEDGRNDTEKRWRF